MVDLFLSIETVPDMDAGDYLQAVAKIKSGELGPDSPDGDTYWRCTRGALKHTQGRIALIEYQINGLPVRRLKEWDDGERAILESFYRTLQDLQRQRDVDPLRIIGHNILSYDIPFLYSRMRLHGLDDDDWLQQWLIGIPLAVDILQVHLARNGMSARGLKHDILAHAYGLPPKGGPASLAEAYFLGEYDRILERQFVYPAMFEKMRDRLVSPEALAESIARYADGKIPERAD